MTGLMVKHWNIFHVFHLEIFVIIVINLNKNISPVNLMINIDLETERLHYTPQLSLQSQPRPHLGLTAGLKPSADLQLGLEEEMKETKKLVAGAAIGLSTVSTVSTTVSPLEGILKKANPSYFPRQNKISSETPKFS